MSRTYNVERLSGVHIVKIVPLTVEKIKRRPASVSTKRVTDAEGKQVTMFTIDADSPSWGDGITYVFQPNVTKARKENKRLFGKADFGPAKA